MYIANKCYDKKRLCFWQIVNNYNSKAALFLPLIFQLTLFAFTFIITNLFVISLRISFVLMHIFTFWRLHFIY